MTYHGPGQLVGYPILALEEERRDLHRYLRDLEAALIDALARFGLHAERSPGLTGVWTSGGKIAAIGVRVSSGWITSHGFALNVATDLRYFETIVPCGLAGPRSYVHGTGARPARSDEPGRGRGGRGSRTSPGPSSALGCGVMHFGGGSAPRFV